MRCALNICCDTSAGDNGPRCKLDIFMLLVDGHMVRRKIDVRRDSLPKKVPHAHGCKDTGQLVGQNLETRSKLMELPKLASSPLYDMLKRENLDLNLSFSFSPIMSLHRI